MAEPLIGEAWVAAASREELQAECTRLSEMAQYNLRRAWTAEATVKRVEELHVSGDHGMCAGCGWSYPCPTRRALD